VLSSADGRCTARAKDFTGGHGNAIATAPKSDACDAFADFLPKQLEGTGSNGIETQAPLSYPTRRAAESATDFK
jgi:hypothetical protein